MTEERVVPESGLHIAAGEDCNGNKPPCDEVEFDENGEPIKKVHKTAKGPHRVIMEEDIVKCAIMVPKVRRCASA
jgi:hypothetical protein